MRVIFNTNRNSLGPPGAAIYGAWDVVVMWNDYSGGPVPFFGITPLFTRRVTLSMTPTGPGAAQYLITFTMDNTGAPQPRNGRASWNIQPLEPPFDADPNPFVP
jgi:hypothetical protein